MTGISEERKVAPESDPACQSPLCILRWCESTSKTVPYWNTLL